MRITCFSFLLSLVFTSPAICQISFTMTSTVCAQSTVNLVANNSGTNAVSGYSWSVQPAGPVFGAPNASATTLFIPLAGGYTVQLSTQTGTVLATVSATIGVQPLPAVQLAISSNTTCITTNASANNTMAMSKPVQIVATGASSYSILPYITIYDAIISNTFDVRPSVSTCYTVTGTDANGCVGSDVKCITVIPQFTLQTLAGNTVMCVSDSVQLGVMNAQGNFAGTLQQFTYDWFEPVTAPPPSLNFYGTQYVFAYPANAATYTVEAHDTRACASVPAVVTVSVAACLGLNDPLALGREIVAFPNPTGDVLAFRFNWPWAEVSVTDLTGRKVLFYQVVESEQALDLTVLPPGLYVAHLNYGGVTERVRISKN